MSDPKDRFATVAPDSRYATTLALLHAALDDILNAGREPQTGFILMLFPLNEEGGNCNYTSNIVKEQWVALMRDQLARFEGRAVDEPGKA